MKKMAVAREHIENIPELEDLPAGKILLLGPGMEESGLKSYFQGIGREVLLDDGGLEFGEKGAGYEKFSMAIIDESFSLQGAESLDRLFIDLSAVLVTDGILVAFFSSESAAAEGEGVFHTNRNIEQSISRVLEMERITTMMDGTRRVVAKKQGSRVDPV